MPDRVTALCPVPPGTLWQVYAYREAGGTVAVYADPVVALAAIHEVIVTEGGLSGAGPDSHSEIQTVRIQEDERLEYFEESPESRVGLCSGPFVPEEWIERARSHVEQREQAHARREKAAGPGPLRSA